MIETYDKQAREDELRELIRRAREARSHSYSPYSGFAVGAALLTSEGQVFTGTNVENASYGLTICAEMAAVARAISAGSRSFTSIAIVGPDDDAPCFPCGRCRQVLNEFGDIAVITPESENRFRTDRISELLPHAFGPEIRKLKDKGDAS